jgi:hypothetical protein
MLLGQPAAMASRTSEGSMLGNDVVDLRDSDSQVATHPARFDARVFSPSERALLRGGPHASRLRWQLWSAKEAAFKAAKKRRAATVFSPPRFEVALCGGDCGRVLHRRDAQPPECFEVNWWHDADAVHAVARSEDAHRADGSGMLVHGFRRESAGRPTDRREPDTAWGPSSAVRQFACEELGRELSAPTDTLQIRTRGRVPELWLDARPANASLSLSHHGDWIAFACWIDVTSQPRSASAAPGLAS